MENILILRPLNGVFFLAFGIFAAIFLALSLGLRKARESVRQWTLAGLMLVSLAGFFVYKLCLSMDAPYSEIMAAAGKGGFSWWEELPLHLCNINMILIPIAALTKRRSLMSFSFFAAPLGALMALLMPSVGFSDYSLLLPRMLGYYGTHFMVFFGGIALCSFGIYTPSYRDFLRTALLSLGLIFFIFLINMSMRHFGLNAHANYFYCVEPEGNPILCLFYRLIPIPFLYTLPGAFIFLPYMALVTLPFHLHQKKK